jgi:hypothetical protein
MIKLAGWNLGHAHPAPRPAFAAASIEPRAAGTFAPIAWVPRHRAR